MRGELGQIEDDGTALRWAAGCVAAASVQRVREGGLTVNWSMLFRKPSAYVPLVLSFLSLALIVVFVAVVGVVESEDEGLAAHLFQLMMVAQVPIIAYFAVRWVPRAPRKGLTVLALQLVAAFIPVALIVLLEM